MINGLNIFLIWTTFSLICFAGYGKTHWGMTLSKVKNIYPGGEITKQNGHTEYNFIDEVSEHKDTLIVFSFNKKLKLDGVSLIFSKSGQNINLKTGDFTQMTKDQCEIELERLKNNLILKYGKPQEFPNLKNIKAISWLTKDDFIIIDCVSTGDPTFAAPIIMYSDVPKLNQQLKGL